MTLSTGYIIAAVIWLVASYLVGTIHGRALAYRQGFKAGLKLRDDQFHETFKEYLPARDTSQ